MPLHFTLDLLWRLKSSRNVLEGRNVFVAFVKQDDFSRGPRTWNALRRAARATCGPVVMRGRRGRFT